MNRVWFQENTWEDIESYLQERKVVLVPMGSVEQHARHLPLGTDAYVAIKVAEEAGMKTSTLVAPPSWLGWAPHHMAFGGTITLRPETLIALTEDICHSLIYHGFEKIILVNGHREANLPPLKTAITRVRNETGAYLAIVDPKYIAAEVGAKIRKSAQGGVGHAGEMETSHMMHLLPELCKMDRAVKNVPEKHRLLQHDLFYEGDRVFAPSYEAEYRTVTKEAGVIGDPTAANSETGRTFHEAVVNHLIEFIQHVEQDIQVGIKSRRLPL